MATLVTGAFGRVGTALIDHAKGDHKFLYLDRVEHPKLETTKADIADYPAIADAMDDVDNVVHLAAASRVDDPWPTVLQSNIVGSYNCLEAARRNGIESFVLASTNHVVGMYEKDHAPELYGKGYELILDHETPVRPDSLYGVSKVFSEALARYYGENYTHPENVYVLRIASVRGPEYDHPYGDAERGVHLDQWEQDCDAYNYAVHRMKATWLSRRDVSSLIQACLRDDSISFGVFYGTSDNARSWFDLQRTQEKLGYRPQDSADEWDDPPEGGKRVVPTSAAHHV